MAVGNASKGRFYRYFIPEEIPGYVDLRVANIYGYMTSGKTTLSRKIAARIEEEVGDKWGFIYIEARRQLDALEWCREHYDEIKDLKYIVIVYDDAGRYYLSRESSSGSRREDVKDFMEIRHFFEDLGFTRMMLTVIANIQFDFLLEKTLRNSPLTIWKSLVAMDSRLRREMLLRLGAFNYSFLNIVTKAMFISRFKPTLDDVVGRSRLQKEEILEGIIEIFRRYGVDPYKGIPKDFVKRFAVVDLLGDVFRLDTGNDVKIPRNYVKVDARTDGLFTTRDTRERDNLLAAVYLGYRLAQFFPDMNKDELARWIRKITGLRFRHQRYYDIIREVEQLVEVAWNSNES